MEFTSKPSFSIQAQLIREMQAQEGKEPCYASPASAHCTADARSQCAWRHDCFDEAGEHMELPVASV